MTLGWPAAYHRATDCSEDYCQPTRSRFERPRCAGRGPTSTGSSVAPGDRVTLRVSAEASHEVDIVRLGRSAVIGPDQDIAADRADVQVLGGWSHPAPARQALTHGSYIFVGGPPVPG